MNIDFKKIAFIKFPKDIPFAQHSLLQPTPILISPDVIRVFCGMRDEHGRSRVGFVDLSARNPAEVISYSRRPCLDLGEPGMFDESGVVPCAVAFIDGRLHLFYAGYQLGQSVRFYVFSGVAVSDDNGATFERQKIVPLIERSDAEPLFRVIHSILPTKNGWATWYGAGTHFREGNSKTLPVYDVKYMEADNIYNFPTSGQTAITLHENEHRVGRPYVVRTKKLHYMFYGYGSESEPYRLGLATSKDGISWERSDSVMKAISHDEEWETEMQAYPAFISTSYGDYFFYNGNNYGRDGFSCCSIKGLD